MREKWIDGKPIYRKSIPITNWPNNSTSSNLHGLSDIGTVVNLSMVAFDGSNYKSMPYLYAPAGSSADIGFYANSTSIMLKSTGDLRGYQGTAIIEYTKTS